MAAARRPEFYEAMAVPDTTPGRFELICAHVALVIRRLRAEGSRLGDDLAQATFDAMFADMDVTLREMGIGDMTVGKRVKKLWEGFHGRAEAYAAALAAADDSALAEALTRNIWAKEPPPPGAALAVGRRLAEADAILAAQPIEDLVRGEARFA
ncbi:ubiquinol-cytochrome C chaperone family protein [Roseococcus sp. YIM B11640]|uniref:ubiquinol-cytochrome C chaperone family protein n=1 Tax=Roseococcus sp. YIM B11640 TaxID=3133973 RepID=UPI003C7A4CB0